MRYRLALDVGTASLGLIALSLDDANDPVDIVHSDLRIFSEPILPAKSGGVGEPKKAARRAARVARRLIERRARRYRRIAHLASLLGLKREDVLPDSGQAIHHVRATAASERIDTGEFKTDPISQIMKPKFKYKHHKIDGPNPKIDALV